MARATRSLPVPVSPVINTDASVCATLSKANEQLRDENLHLRREVERRYAFDQKRFSEAGDLFENPKWKGMAHYRSGRYLEAAEIFARIQSADGLFNMGKALVKGREYAQGVEAYRQALAEDPEHRPARQNLAIAEAIIARLNRIRLQEDTGEQTELGVAGGLMGQAVSIVRAETSDVMFPATAEMAIEGEIPLDAMEPEGPFAEFYGVMGEAKSENFFMNVTAVTHRKNPWFLNSYSGIIRNAIAVPREATLVAKYRDRIPGLLAIHVPQQAAGSRLRWPFPR